MTGVDGQGASPAHPGTALPKKPTEANSSPAHLRARLEALESRVAAAIDRRRAARAAPADDRFRGVFLSDHDVDALLAAPPPAAAASDERPDAALADAVETAVDAAEAAGHTTRLRALRRRFDLDALELDLLVTALAPDLDRRFERLYGYLHDDLTRRRASVGLALELAGVEPDDAAGRAAVSPAGRLVGFGLLAVGDADRPFLTRSLQVPDRVAAFLVGDDRPDPDIEPFLVATVAYSAGQHAGMVRALEAGTRLFYAQESPGSSGGSVFAAALQDVGLVALELDFGVLPAGTSLTGLVPAVVRETGLQGAGLIVDHADELAARDPYALRRLSEVPAIVCFVGTSAWDPAWTRLLPHTVEVGSPAVEHRVDLWTAVVGPELDDGHPGWPAGLGALRISPREMVRAVDSARRRAASEARPLDRRDLQGAALRINAAPLERLSTRIPPRATWDDLVLAPAAARAVRKVAERERNREFVHQTWGLDRSSRRRGTVALFTGPPGTGKTLAAEVIATDLGLDLYVVNLATVIDKYIGETEKNLERVFRAAEEANGLLFFDEADALFGKRSEVRDARDRYANVEVAYLLQRLERFDGLVVLATNLGSNVDEAFSRRLDVSVDFRRPDATQRRAIWDLCLPASVPRDDDVDLDFLAEAFELAGGSIRNMCVEAAFMAREAGTDVTMAHLIRAAALEHRKLGLMLAPDHFGPYLALATEELSV